MVFYDKIRQERRYGWYALVLLILIVFSWKILPTLNSGGVSPADQTTNSAIEPVPRLENGSYDWEARHAEVLSLVASEQFDLVFIGDSITQYFGGIPKPEISRGDAVWEKYYGNRQVLNLGFGWDRTQNVLWRLQNGHLEGISPKVAVVMIGTNNLMETASARRNTPVEILAGIDEICTLIQTKVRGCQIILMGILPRSEAEFRSAIREINSGLELIGGGDRVTFLDLGPAFTRDDGAPRPEVMLDRVHPNQRGYELWAEALEPLLVEYLPVGGSVEIPAN